MKSVRGLWAAVVLAPSVFLAEKAAKADVLLPAVGEEWVLDHNCRREGLGPHDARCFSSRWVPKSVHEARHIDAIMNPKAASCDGKPITAYSTTNTPGAMMAADLQTAYGLNDPGLPTGEGKIVAVIDACGYGSLLTDLAAYRTANNLPAISECGSANGVAPTPGGTQCIGIVSQTGTATLPADDSDWSGETALDVQMVSDACPLCSILVVQATSSGSLTTALNEAVKLKADGVSNSWGSEEDNETITVKAGSLVTAATGDADYLNEINETDYPDGGVSFAYTPGTPNWPASSPDVVGIGGTTLTKDSTSARCYTDVAWSYTVPATSTSPYAGDTVYGGGSGCSTQYATPSYQSSVAMGSCKMRGSVDISAPADFNVGAWENTICVKGQSCGGIAVYGGGGWNPSVGTSAATPFATAVLVRTGLAGSASTLMNTTAAPGPAYLYTNGSAFIDVTSGNNDPSKTCSDVMCNAGTGWDGPTGWGTPGAYALAVLGGATGVTQVAPVCPTAPAGSSSGGSSSGSSSGGSSSSGGTTSSSGGSSSGSSSGGSSSGSGGGSGSGSGSGSGGGSGSSSGGNSGSSSGSSAAPPPPTTPGWSRSPPMTPVRPRATAATTTARPALRRPAVVAAT